jgi:hypothetical protein
LSDIGGPFRRGQQTLAATRGCQRWSIQILNLVYTFLAEIWSTPFHRTPQDSSAENAPKQGEED